MLVSYISSVSIFIFRVVHIWIQCSTGVTNCIFRRSCHPYLSQHVWWLMTYDVFRYFGLGLRPEYCWSSCDCDVYWLATHEPYKITDQMYPHRCLMPPPSRLDRCDAVWCGACLKPPPSRLDRCDVVWCDVCLMPPPSRLDRCDVVWCDACLMPPPSRLDRCVSTAPTGQPKSTAGRTRPSS